MVETTYYVTLEVPLAELWTLLNRKWRQLKKKYKSNILSNKKSDETIFWSFYCFDILNSEVESCLALSMKKYFDVLCLAARYSQFIKISEALRWSTIQKRLRCPWLDNKVFSYRVSSQQHSSLYRSNEDLCHMSQEHRYLLADSSCRRT